ncbi:CoA transferase [Anopheles sinensis]|uniref:CoA transferase n=1 Tax=Anopheles sinensis TaxID=74873 RepID=A0A084WT87_ANOSI|nr:CoA transferase [Anopheles sinensis]
MYFSAAQDVRHSAMLYVCWYFSMLALPYARANPENHQGALGLVQLSAARNDPRPEFIDTVQDRPHG